MTALWLSIPLGLLIVAAAVGIPVWLAHRRMRPHYELSESVQYLADAGKTPQEALQGRPARLQEENGKAKLPTPPSRGEGPAG